MSKLKFADRWMNYAPDWLGNLDQAVAKRPGETEDSFQRREREAEPFRVRFKRLTVAEVEAVKDGWRKLVEQRIATAGELVALLGGAVQGPFGTLEIDGEAIAEGNIEALLSFAARESLILPSLAGELVHNLVAMNTLSNDAEGKSERRPGGTGMSSDPVAAESTTVPPPAAAAAELSSPAETTS